MLEGVGKSFGAVRALSDVDLTVDRGEVVVLIGPSGSGKSTLCRCINRLETIDTGRILIDGSPLPEEGKALARLRADIGMVFQSFNLFAHKTIIQNVMLGPMKVRKQSGRDGGERVVAAARQAPSSPEQAEAVSKPAAKESLSQPAQPPRNEAKGDARYRPPGPIIQKVWDVDTGCP